MEAGCPNESAPWSAATGICFRRQTTFPGAGTLRAAADGAGQKINSDSSAVTSQLHALDQQEKTALQALSQQMTNLKEKHQADATPLQQQLVSFNTEFETAMYQLRARYNDTRSQDDDARAALMDRLKPGYLSLHNEKKSSLANVNGQEEQSIQSLRQQEDAELQSIREKYDAQRKSLQQESGALRQTINSQFDTAVKALK
jgi:hypothetical protein